MRKSILLILILISSLLTYPQTSGKHKDTTIINIDIGCGYAGYTSESISLVRNFLLVKNDSGLVNLLFSKNNKIKLLAIIAIDNTSKGRIFPLTKEQTDIISNFKKTKYPIEVCYTCSGHYRTTVRKIFKKSNSESRKIIDRELIRTQK